MTSRSAWAVCVLIKHLAIYVCFELEEKGTFYFANNEGFDECMHRTCGGQYLQQGY